MVDARILQLTDLHLFCDTRTTLKGIPTRKTLREVVDSIRRDEAEFDRVVVTGDHTHDERPESYAAVRRMLEPWIDRLAIVPGNHDDREVMRLILGDVVEQHAPDPPPEDDRITFAFRCGSWLCLGLDSHAPGQVPGRLGTAQAAWLAERLADHGDKPSVLFCHHPPVDVGSDWMDAIGLQDRSLLLDIVQQHPSLQLICCGHVHHEFEGNIGNTRVVTTPSTGIQFDPRGSTARFAADPPGYRVIEITGDQIRTHAGRLPHVDHVPVND